MLVYAIIRDRGTMKFFKPTGYALHANSTTDCNKIWLNKVARISNLYWHSADFIGYEFLGVMKLSYCHCYLAKHTKRA